jgi:hypothetical protein
MEAVRALATTDDATLSRLIAWLPLPPTQRPARLFETGLPQDSALFPALLTTAFIGIKAPELPTTLPLLQKLPWDKSNPLRLQLLQALATRAEREQATRLHLLFLSEAARHPDAQWPQVQALVDASLATQMTDEAIALLSDWLDDPPAAQDAQSIANARRTLARLHLTSRNLAAATITLLPLLQPSPKPDLDALDIAWTLVGLSKDPAPLIPLIESALSQHPQHQLHWRELTTASKPDPHPSYLLWLTRLASACLQTQKDARAIEASLHLALLESPDHLLPILPSANRLGRFPEVLDLLDRLESEPESESKSSPGLILALAEASYQRQDLASTRLLLEHQLQKHPGNLAATRLLLQVKTHDLPPMQAAMHWRRHLQQHPSDLPAQHQLIAAWLSAAQPQAAVNHLLAANPVQLDTALRLQTALLALENRQNTDFPRAIQRLLDAKDSIPQENRALWTQHLEALNHPALAQALR